MNSSKVNIVVVIEDDPDDQYLIKKALSASPLNIDIMFIGNGAEAISYFSDTQPSISAGKGLVLLDLNLPGASGFQVLESIRSIERYASLPVVILTTSNFENEKVTAKEMGASDYIVKPDKLHKFKELLGQVLQEYIDTKELK